MAEKKIYLTTGWPGLTSDTPQDEEEDDVFSLKLPTVLVANKSDLDPDPDEVKVLEELLGLRYPALTVSAACAMNAKAAAIRTLNVMLIEAFQVVPLSTGEGHCY